MATAARFVSERGLGARYRQFHFVIKDIQPYFEQPVSDPSSWAFPLARHASSFSRLFVDCCTVPAEKWESNNDTSAERRFIVMRLNLESISRHGRISFLHGAQHLQSSLLLRELLLDLSIIVASDTTFRWSLLLFGVVGVMAEVAHQEWWVFREHVFLNLGCVIVCAIIIRTTICRERGESHTPVF